MPNPENVEHYGAMIHDAAQAGGPKKYLEELKESNYKLGRLDQQKEDLILYTIVLAGLATGNAVVRWVKKVRQKKKEELETVSAKAERSIIQESVGNVDIFEPELNGNNN